MVRALKKWQLGRPKSLNTPKFPNFYNAHVPSSEKITNRRKFRKCEISARAGHFRYFLISSLIKNEFLHFLSS